MWIPLIAVALAEPAPEHRGCDFSEKKFTDRYNEMVGAVNAVDLRAVVKLGHKLVDEQPGCLGALLTVTSAHLRLADPDAIALAAAGARLHPDIVLFPVMESQARFIGQDFEGALDAARRARVVAPADVEALDTEVSALVRLGRYPEAHASLDAAGGVAAGDVACLRIGVFVDERRLPDATALREACQGAAPSPLRSNTLSNLARLSGDEQAMLEHGAELVGVFRQELDAARALNEGRCAEAVVLYEQLLAVEPWDSIHHINLAAALSCAGERKRAKAELTQLLGAEDWTTVYASGAITGVTTRRTEQEVDEALQVAIGRLVRALVEDGEVDDARVALRKAEARYGRTAALATARVALERATGGPDAAWVEARAALRSWPTDADLLDLVGHLAFEATGGLDAATLDALAEHGDGVAHHNTMSGLQNANRDAECAAFALRVLPRQDDAHRPTVRRLGHICAVRGGDLRTADALYGGVAAEVRPASLAHHARLLVAAGRNDDAEALARGVLGDAEAAPTAVDVLAGLASDAGRLDDALALAKRAEARPITRFNVSVDLYNAQRFADARDVARGIECGGFTDVAHCRSFLGALSEAP